ncbi:MAG: RNA polymerase sigma factor [Anaerolineae bacterium]|nr:RNA polymerase sigma factor [Anaerolineae bacterium]NUQ03532.1 RNA polymerase sigma factor [Anaerolineae bacterium]
MQTDEALAAALQRGDTEALDLLVSRHYDALTGYCFRLLHGDRALAQDMAQETFLRVLRSIEQYRPPRPFKPWLYAIATHLARDHYSRADTRRTASMPDVDETHPIFIDADLNDDRLMAQDEAREVIDALAALPDAQREVLILYFYQDLPLMTIAETLDIPLGTVKSRLYHGVARLRERMLSDERR